LSKKACLQGKGSALMSVDVTACLVAEEEAGINVALDTAPKMSTNNAFMVKDCGLKKLFKIYG
jgi:hypothetical protein